MQLITVDEALYIEVYLLFLQLHASKASLTEYNSYEAYRQNELQQRCNKYEQYAEQYRAQRVCSSAQCLPLVINTLKWLAQYEIKLK